MNLKIHSISSFNFGHLNTEITFNIASARAQGAELVVLKSNQKSFEAITSSRIERILRTLKKRDFIVLFASSEDFKQESPVAQYVLNKHPDISELLAVNESTYYIVKL